MAAFDPHEHGTNTEVALTAALAALVVLVALAGVLVRKARRALGGA